MNKYRVLIPSHDINAPHLEKEIEAENFEYDEAGVCFFNTVTKNEVTRNVKVFYISSVIYVEKLVDAEVQS